MLCRVADDLYWMSRYVERAVSVARLLDVTEHLELDAGDANFWAPLVGEGSGLAATDVRHYLTADHENPDSLVSSVRRARELGRGIREAITSEMWEELNTLHATLTQRSRVLAGTADPDQHVLLRRRLQHFQGLADATLAHDETWQFLTLGTHLERAANVARLIDRQAHLLAPEEVRTDPTVAALAVLRSCGAAEAYARYYSLRVEPIRIVEFLVLNPVFPQTVHYALGVALGALRAISALRTSAGNDAGPALRTLGRLNALVEHTEIDDVFEGGLPAFLRSIQDGIAQTSDQVGSTYFRDQPTGTTRVAAVARASEILARQQQAQQ